jgi:hypothetical protein
MASLHEHTPTRGAVWESRAYQQGFTLQGGQHTSNAAKKAQ